MPRILVAEDNESMRELIVEVLKANCYVVASVENGQKAITFLQSGEKIDLVITDFQMPEMNGLELIRQIKKEEKFSKIPVILATGQAYNDDIRREAGDAGACAIIGKPFFSTELMEAVEGAIGPPERREEN